jgi:hypothetical protein
VQSSRKIGTIRIIIGDHSLISKATLLCRRGTSLRTMFTELGRGPEPAPGLPFPDSRTAAVESGMRGLSYAGPIGADSRLAKALKRDVLRFA